MSSSSSRARTEYIFFRLRLERERPSYSSAAFLEPRAASSSGGNPRRSLGPGRSLRRDPPKPQRRARRVCTRLMMMTMMAMMMVAVVVMVMVMISMTVMMCNDGDDDEGEDSDGDAQQLAMRQGTNSTVMMKRQGLAMITRRRQCGVVVNNNMSQGR